MICEHLDDYVRLYVMKMMQIIMSDYKYHYNDYNDE